MPPNVMCFLISRCQNSQLFFSSFVLSFYVCPHVCILSVLLPSLQWLSEGENFACSRKIRILKPVLAVTADLSGQKNHRPSGVPAHQGLQEEDTLCPCWKCKVTFSGRHFQRIVRC